MRYLPYLLCCTVLVATATAACGGSATPGSQTSDSQTSGSQPTSSPAQTSHGQPPVFPLTITRTGGIAGFRDVVVVTGDGSVSIARKGQAPRHCTLSPSAFKLLTAAATHVSWSPATPARTEPSFPDDMVTSVQSPAGGPVRLGDPQAGSRGQVFHELLSNLNELDGRSSPSDRCPAG